MALGSERTRLTTNASRRGVGYGGSRLRRTNLHQQEEGQERGDCGLFPQIAISPISVLVFCARQPRPRGCVYTRCYMVPRDQRPPECNAASRFEGVAPCGGPVEGCGSLCYPERRGRPRPRLTLPDTARGRHSRPNHLNAPLFLSPFFLCLRTPARPTDPTPVITHPFRQARTAAAFPWGAPAASAN